MNRKRIATSALLVLSALLTPLSGCGQSGQAKYASPRPSSAAHTPDASPVDSGALVREALDKARRRRIDFAGSYLERSFRKELKFDMSELVGEMELLLEEGGGIAAAMRRRDMALNASRSLTESALAALKPALDELHGYLPLMGGSGVPKLEIELRTNEPDWRCVLAFCRTCVTLMRQGVISELLARSAAVSADLSYDEDANVLSGELSVTFPGFAELWRLCAANPQDYITGSISYAYMATVYDDEGKVRPYREPEGVSAALSDIASPVRGGVIRRTWYAGRDGGSRLHTGIDILAPEGAPIYSCARGEVICVAEGLGAGNYVVVRDDLGYEYHYYHMVRLSSFLSVGQRVEKGEFIGSVGNTGNSDRDHLHLSVIEPNGEYVNAYQYLVDAEERRVK